MRLRTIKGRTVDEALERLQTELGPNALVLETTHGEHGAEVVAAEVEREDPADGLMRLRAELALLRRDLLHAGVTGGAGAVAAHATHPEKSADAAAGAPEDSEKALPAVATRLALVAEQLVRHGVDGRLIRRVLSSVVHAPASEGDPLDPRRSDFVRNALAGILPGNAVGGARRPRGFAFVGPAGAGKTTTIAKLMQQARGQTAGAMAVAVLSLDADRPGGSELLAKTAERLGVPFRSARGAADFTKALAELPPAMTLLIDTAGLGLRDHAVLEALRHHLKDKNSVAVHLVLPAHLEPATLLHQARRLKVFEPGAVVFTHLDETERLGALINVPCALDLPVAALAHGRSLTGDLVPATRALVANVVLGRRPDVATIARIESNDAGGDTPAERRS